MDQTYIDAMSETKKTAREIQAASCATVEAGQICVWAAALVLRW